MINQQIVVEKIYTTQIVTKTFYYDKEIAIQGIYLEEKLKSSNRACSLSSLIRIKKIMHIYLLEPKCTYSISKYADKIFKAHLCCNMEYVPATNGHTSS